MGSFLLTAVGIAFAVQAPQATVVGTVRASESGEPLAGAVVALTDLDRAALTDSFGRYAFPDVPPGPQHLTVRSIGYAVRTLHALVPPEGELQINIALRPDPVSLAGIEVRVTVPVRGVESGASAAFLDRGISVAAVRSHPLLAEPDVFQALGGGHVVVSPESPSGVHIRGGSSDQTAYLLDGIPVFSPYHAAGVFSAWNPDALSMLTLSSTSPSPVFLESLSGTVAAVTRTPGSQFRAQGGVSTTQARVTVDGPLGVAGAGYLLSLRSGFPGVVAPRDEPSYVTGETGDWLASIEAPAFGGRMRFLGYDNENKIDAAAVEAPDATGPESGRNVFEWRSRSMGAEWTRAISSVSVRFRGWRATGAAGAIWAAENGSPTNMTAARRDEGLLAVVERSASRATTVAGVRVERTRTTYRVKSGSGDRPSLAMGARTPVATAFIQHARGIAPRTEAELMASLATAAGDVLLGPRVQLRWKPSELLAFSGSYARLHQFAQSLRNAESVVGNIFPVDLYLGAG
ncbi:MAG: carboxypeptidase regulatory-like domain-containing protein, partial [Gemmatimonadetes bacterium]|nr:carboxypeptidase regulatory-like domain-containing protein [Gemmatimonadota bacterium]